MIDSQDFKLYRCKTSTCSGPAFAKGWNIFLGKVRNGLSLDARLRELPICAVAIVNRAPYELAQHSPKFLACGGTKSQLARLEDIDTAALDEIIFNDQERAVLALTIEMTRNIQVVDEIFDCLKSQFPNHQEQVEIIGIISCYNMVSRFLGALHIPLD
jgi:alkylhydroperoxidase family enzyme